MGRTFFVAGLVLNVEGRFVCWHSHRACWFLGPRRLSEVFGWHPIGEPSRQMREALALYPSARVVYERDRSA